MSVAIAGMDHRNLVPNCPGSSCSPHIGVRGGGAIMQLTLASRDREKEFGRLNEWPAGGEAFTGSSVRANFDRDRELKA